MVETAVQGVILADPLDGLFDALIGTEGLKRFWGAFASGVSMHDFLVFVH